MQEFKPEKYGVWTIRIRKTKQIGRGSTSLSIKSSSIIIYEYKIELYGQDISHGWVSVPYGSNKQTTLSYAVDAIESNYKKTTLLSEHGGILRHKYNQFGSSFFG